MWIDYQKSKKAVERNLYLCRDYILRGYFSIDDKLTVKSHFTERFSESAGSYLQISGNNSSENKLLNKLFEQAEQLAFIENILDNLIKLDTSHRQVIIYHYLKGYSLNDIKLGFYDKASGNHIKISKANEKNREALYKLMIFMDDCLIPFVGNIDTNEVSIKHKAGAINFVVKRKKS